MFTGLVEAIGEVRGIRDRAGVREIRIRSPFPLADLRKGASISVQGVCLTLSADGKPDGTFRVEAVRETLRRTTLSRLRAGESVHLERPLAVGDRLGGHFVQGHVDGIGRVEGIHRVPGEWMIDVAFPDPIAPYIVEKGSIAIDGVSLTVGKVSRGRFRVHIVPATAKATLLARLRSGTPVNLEVDMIAKYALSLGGLEPRASRRSVATPRCEEEPT